MKSITRYLPIALLVLILTMGAKITLTEDMLGTDGSNTSGATAYSVLGAVGTNEATADTPFSSSTVAADADGSVLERLEAIEAAQSPSYNNPNYFVVTADLTSATWNTVAAHEIAVVTGACRVKILIEVTGTCATTSTDGTFALGFAGNTASMMAATALDSGGTTFTAGDVVSAVYGSAGTTPVGGANAVSALTSCIFDVVATGGVDIGYTIATHAATSGTLKFHIWWTPLDSTGAVTAGAGGAF